jgi:hypothetical protein
MSLDSANAQVKRGRDGLVDLTGRNLPSNEHGSLGGGWAACRCDLS